MRNVAFDGPRVSERADTAWGSAGCLIQLAGPMVALVVAVTASLLVGAAWSACDDANPGGVGFLVVTFLPGTFLASWAAFASGGFLAFPAPPPLRLALAVALAFAVGVLAVAEQVPAYPDSDYPLQSSSVRPTCGPSGIPTWWPAWLPH